MCSYVAMKINTSNNDEANIEPCSSEEVEAYRQGYAKALDDVTKILNELCLKCPIQDDKECWCKPLEIALKEIANLTKEKPDCFLGGVPVKEKKAL